MVQHRYQASGGDEGAWAGAVAQEPEVGGMQLWCGPALLPSMQVNNLGARDLPISINFLVPLELNQVSVWTDVEVSHPQVLLHEGLSSCSP